MLRNDIGEDAGKIWNLIKDNGKMSTSAVMNALQMPERKLLMAIGWLAREDKLKFHVKGKQIFIELQ